MRCFWLVPGFQPSDTKGVNNILKMLDGLLAKLPPAVIQMIRLGSLLIWLILGTIVAIFAWSTGTRRAPQSGQDLSLVELRERIQREKNEKAGAPVTIPDIGEFVDEERSDKMPFKTEKRKEKGLAGSDNKLIEPENPIRGSGELPPFLGDRSEPMRNTERSALPPDRTAEKGQSLDPDRTVEKPRLPMKEPGPKKDLPTGKVPSRDGMPGLLPLDH